MWEWPQPVMLYFKSAFKNPFGGALKKNREGKDAKPMKDPRRFADLEIIGNQKSIAEATLLQTAFTILGEAGYTNLCVDINSIGDRECMQRFSKDLMNYYRKHINDMSAESRQLLKKDPFLLLASTEEAARELNSHAPSTLAYLSEASRCHFQEVLEYLEALDIPYRINNALIGNRKYCTETIFEIISQEEGKKTPETLGVGVRYDGLAKRLNFKKEVAGIGFTFLLKNPHTDLRKPVLTTKKPYVYFIQLGFEAKLLSLKAIELLRAAKIPVFQSLPKDKIGAQVSMAEKTHTPFTVIIGKKEALDKTAIVRYTESREQHSVPIGELAAYLKNLGL
jgi:histidyl-tRNA synthetase